MRKLLWIGLMLVSLGTMAENDAVFINSWALQSFYNPAAAGLDPKLNVQGAYSMQMMGFQDAPHTMLVQADMPLFFLTPKIGAGAAFEKDDAGMFSVKRVTLQLAYHQKLLGGRLSFGVRPVLLMEGFDGSDLDVEDASDPAFASSEVSGTAFDLDAGLRYTYKNLWYAGVSGVHLLSPTVTLGDDKTHQVKVDANYYAQAGYKLHFRYPRYMLALDGLLRTDLQSWRGDITARLLYEGTKHKIYGGLMYSPTISVGALVGFDFHGINLGYSYEAYTNGIGMLHGSHEFIIGYEHDLDFGKKGKNMHKSVRLL